MTAILTILPKQRRTSLFSATQCTNFEELVKFGLRNPVRLEVSNEKEITIHEGLPDDSECSLSNSANPEPKELTNYFSVRNNSI